MQKVEKVAKELYPFNDGFQIKDVDISEELQIAFINGAKYQQNNISLFLTELKERIDSFEYTVNQNSYIKELIDEWTQKQ